MVSEPKETEPARGGKAFAYADLRRRILTLDLAPGAVLDEVRLSAEYGISRTPLREVLRRLASEGCVEQRDNRGAAVAPMGLDTLRSFFQAAPMIYASVARLAAANRSAEQLGKLLAIQDRLRAAGDAQRPDVDALVTLNEAFHRAIGRMAANPYLLASLERLLIDHARIGQTFWCPRDAAGENDRTEAIEQHDRMIEAIAAGDQATAVDWTLRHWALSRAHIEAYARPDPLPLMALGDTSDPEAD